MKLQTFILRAVFLWLMCPVLVIVACKIGDRLYPVSISNAKHLTLVQAATSTHYVQAPYQMLLISADSERWYKDYAYVSYGRSYAERLTVPGRYVYDVNENCAPSDPVIVTVIDSNSFIMSDTLAKGLYADMCNYMAGRQASRDNAKKLYAMIKSKYNL